MVPRDLTASQGIELWAEWLDTCEEFLLAGLRRQVGPDGDLHAAYRQWYAEQMAEHDRTMRPSSRRVRPPEPFAWLLRFS